MCRSACVVFVFSMNHLCGGVWVCLCLFFSMNFQVIFNNHFYLFIYFFKTNSGFFDGFPRAFLLIPCAFGFSL